MIWKQNLSRRRFIAGGAALAALPLLSHSSATAEVDVVVVGAGAAGLAATRELLGRGVSVAALEASSRVPQDAEPENTTCHDDTRAFLKRREAVLVRLRIAQREPPGVFRMRQRLSRAGR